MKYFVVLVIAGILISCTGGNNKSGDASSAPASEESQLVSFKFKVDGLQDAAIADSIFRLHFKIEGIDKMIISEKDCTVVFTVDPELLNYEGLYKAVEEQGGVVLKN